MKQALLFSAVFLYLSAAAQQPTTVPGKEIAKYTPAKVDHLKKFKQAESASSVNNQINSFTVVQEQKPTYDFKPLHQYLTDDIHQYQIQKNNENWTQFTSGILSSFQQKKWNENRNYSQQRWMAQKVKGK